MITLIIIVIALLIDVVFGEPRRWHPLVGFGRIANYIEKKCNKFTTHNPWINFLSGFFAWTLLVFPVVILFWYIEQQSSMQAEIEIILGIIALSFAIGTKSLVQHARAVSNSLKEADIKQARKNIAMIVSRDTSNSDEAAITTATIESVLENGSDAIFAAIFWFILLGAPGVIFYRLANTLDAMWGYRTERFNYFGRTAARIDDILNWLPARLTALSYALAGNTLSALSCWKKQARQWHGINPGVVMASGAGALHVLLGGTATYHGQQVSRPELGCGIKPLQKDIDRAIHLLYKSIIIWLVFIAIGTYLLV